jgi:hypothetical protein
VEVLAKHSLVGLMSDWLLRSPFLRTAGYEQSQDPHSGTDHWCFAVIVVVDENLDLDEEGKEDEQTSLRSGA